MRMSITTAIVTMTLGMTLLVGCSDESSTISNSSTASTGTVTDYFPMELGYTTSYEVTHNNGTVEQVTFVIGDPVTINGTPAVEWKVYRDGSVSTSYLEATDDAINYWDTDRSARETILKLPLSKGSSWSRFSTEGSTNGVDGPFTGIITDPWNKYDLDTTTSINDGVLGKNFPTIGSEIMTVDDIENLDAGTSGTFANTVHITTTGSMGRTNHYWFAEKVGLVKYIIGTTVDTYPDGEKTGELVMYGN